MKMDERTKMFLREQMKRTYTEFEKFRVAFDEATRKEIAEATSDWKTVYESKKEEEKKNEDFKGWPITCSDCGVEDFVPFEPQYNSKLYCRKCFSKNNGRG